MLVTVTAVWQPPVSYRCMGRPYCNCSAVLPNWTARQQRRGGAEQQ